MAAEKDQVVDISQQCVWLALDVSGELGFGKSFELQSSTKNRWMPPGISAMNWIINIYLQFPTLRKMGLEYFVLPIILFRFHRMVSDMIKQRLTLETHARPDLFASVSGYKDPETGKHLSQEELWAESTLLIPAAGDTITSLMWAQIKHGPKLAGCRYLRAFFDETLRISPPGGTTLWRDIPDDSSSSPVIIDGYVIPPSTQVGVNIYAIHHNEAYFPSPFAFKPERWIPEESGLSSEETKKMHSAYIPFSRGSRNCPGMAMAFAEASLAIAKTLWYFDFEKHGSDLGSAEAGKPLIFRMEDQVGSRHTGPQLRFRRREGFWQEL